MTDTTTKAKRLDRRKKFREDDEALALYLERVTDMVAWQVASVPTLN